MNFAHLHVHTEYSLLDGSNKIKEYVSRVKELGMDSAAITDHGVMYGVIDFYKEAKAQGIKPILGCEVYVAPNSRFDKETTGGEDRYYHLVLLAENNQGYQNLMKIVSDGFTVGFYYRRRVDKDHGIPEQRQVNQSLLRMSRELGIELVATNDVHYTYEDDVKPHDILLCLQTGKRLADEDRMRYEGGQYFVKSPEQMAQLFPYALPAL